MSTDQNDLGRRKLLVLGAAVGLQAACSGAESTPYGAGGSPPGSAEDAGSGGSDGAAGDAGDAGTSDGSSSGGADAGGACSCSTTGNVLSLPFSKYPQLQKVGGSATLNANGYRDPNCGQSNIIVIQHAAGQFVALSTSCTHACCAVSFTGSGFRCPCHGATFDITGKHTGGPGAGSLATLQVCSDSCGVHITLA